MGRHERLDNVEHHDLRVITQHGAAFGDNLNQALVVPTEFAELQREYPILFRQGAAGEFEAFALLGLDEGENLFLDDAGWQARYIPAIQRRGPFMIGLSSRDGQAEPMVHIDLADARVSRTEGEPLFLRHGGNAPGLERILQSLRLIHLGAQIKDAMFAAFIEAGLLAPIEVDIKLDDSTEYKLPGLFSISREALTELDGATLERLNRQGFLALAYHVVASMGNMARLIEMKNSRRKTI
jgi:hypothetical protein